MIMYVEEKYKILDPSPSDQRVSLSDGITASYRDKPYSFYLFEFKRNYLVYLMGLSRNVNENWSVDDMLCIANSMSK